MIFQDFVWLGNFDGNFEFETFSKRFLDWHTQIFLGA